MIPQVKLSRWKPHLQAAARQGKTLAQYAREHGLSRYTLYAARQMLHASPGQARTPASRPARISFTAVKLMSAPEMRLVPPHQRARLQVRLTNGVALELTCGDTRSDAEALKTLINTLAALPCSTSTPR